MTNIIKFPITKTTTSSRVRQVLERAREIALKPGDRVRHLTYLWDAVVLHDTENDCRPGEVLVARAYNGLISVPVAVPVRDLLKLYSAGEIA